MFGDIERAGAMAMTALAMASVVAILVIR